MMKAVTITPKVNELIETQIKRVEHGPELTPAEALAMFRVFMIELGNLAASFEHQLLAPIDLVLFCPRCHEQHVDAPEPEKEWTNPPHKSHLCHKCGMIWRPCDRPTNGVRSINTMGAHDTPAPTKCDHQTGSNIASYTHVTCSKCGAILTDSSERDWGIARNTWFKSIEEARFYQKNGRLPDPPP